MEDAKPSRLGDTQNGFRWQQMVENWRNIEGVGFFIAGDLLLFEISVFVTMPENMWERYIPTDNI